MLQAPTAAPPKKEKLAQLWSWVLNSVIGIRRGGPMLQHLLRRTSTPTHLKAPYTSILRPDTLAAQGLWHQCCGWTEMWKFKEFLWRGIVNSSKYRALRATRFQYSKYYFLLPLGRLIFVRTAWRPFVSSDDYSKKKTKDGLHAFSVERCLLTALIRFV